jgi:DNA-binding CsgD family transcriptional regulator
MSSEFLYCGLKLKLAGKPRYMNGNNELSDRELEILRLVATGASNKEIARQLSISANTVKVHLRNIFAKIGVVSRTEAAMYAVREGVLQGVNEKLNENMVNDLFIARDVEQHISKPWLNYILFIFFALILLMFVLLLNNRINLVTLQNTGFSASSTLPTDYQRLQTLPKMSQSRAGLALVTYDNKVYAIGGDDSGGVTGLTESFNPQTNYWTTLSEKPTPVTDVQAAVIGGKIYVPGGRLSNGELSSNLEIYNPLMDEWSRGKNLPKALSAYSLVAFEGNLYLFGGWDTTSYSNVVLEYNPDAEVWSEKSKMLNKLGFSGATVVGGNIHVIGGYDGLVIYSTNAIYSPGNDAIGEVAWKVGKPMPEGRYAMGVANISDTIQIVGGKTKSYESTTNLGFIPITNVWQINQSPLDRPYARLGVTSIGLNLYIAGGEYDNVTTNTFFAYQAVYIISIPIVREKNQ